MQEKTHKIEDIFESDSLEIKIQKIYISANKTIPFLDKMISNFKSKYPKSKIYKGPIKQQ